MSTSAAKIESNRQNAQNSTGPTSPEGLDRSSKNATRHGFTGQSLVLSSEEKEAYETHCISYFEHFSPATHEETDLTQQYADLRWTLHQISVQQSNLLALINAITTKFTKEGDLEAALEATARPYRTLNTLGIYEQRRRRAAEATLQQLTALIAARKEAGEKELAQAAAVYKAHKAQNKPSHPADFGFVCSLPEIEKHLLRQSAAEAFLGRERERAVVQC
jgi:hypothetical protein